MYLPSNIKTKVINIKKHNSLYLYNDCFYFEIYLKNTSIKIKNSMNSIFLETKKSYFDLNKLKTQIKNLNKSLTTYFLKKIKIAGKSYRIEKLGLGFNLTVGHTLKTCIFIKNIIQKQPTKQKLIFYYINSYRLQHNFYKIIYLRLWDVYTQRGLRFGKHKLFKKQGKQSSYV